MTTGVGERLLHCHGRLGFATDESQTIHAVKMLLDRMEE